MEYRDSMNYRAITLALLTACGGASTPETTIAPTQAPPEHMEEAPAVGEAQPVDGVLEMVLHGLRADDQVDNFYAIRWDAEERTYRASRFDHPQRFEVLNSETFHEIVELTETRRDALSLPVNNNDFLIIRAGHITIGLASAPPEGTSPEDIEELRSFSDQWALLGDVAEGSETANRRLATYREIRQSMENLNAVCNDPASDRCTHHTAYAAAYDDVAGAIRDAVNAALGGEPVEVD